MQREHTSLEHTGSWMIGAHNSELSLLEKTDRADALHFVTSLIILIKIFWFVIIVPTTIKYPRPALIVDRFL